MIANVSGKQRDTDIVKRKTAF